MFLVDTNLLVDGANSAAAEPAKARAFLEACRSGAEIWLATWSVFYEFLRITSHPAVMTRPLAFAAAWDFLRAVAAPPSFRLLGETERHAAVIGGLARRHPAPRGNHVHDFHIAALMWEHGAREIRTADADPHRFDFPTVTNPLIAA